MFKLKRLLSKAMRSVPPRDSGWVVDGAAMMPRGSGFARDLVREQTHPLLRGGTDLIASKLLTPQSAFLSQQYGNTSLECCWTKPLSPR
jgi:hypothetical protein